MNLRELEVGLYDVCEWIVETYPDDIFKDKTHPVIKMRIEAQEILDLRKQTD